MVLEISVKFCIVYTASSSGLHILDWAVFCYLLYWVGYEKFRVNPSKSLSILRAQISTDSLNDENEQLENWAKRQPFRNVNEQMLQQFKDFIDWR